MSDLSQGTERLLLDAAGFRELGMIEDSAACMALIPEQETDHPAVLLAWCETDAACQDWQSARDRARMLTVAAPTLAAGWFWLGYALRRSESPAAACQALRPVVREFTNDPVVEYNFACYACLDGQFDEAKEALERVFISNPEWRNCALKDEDLIPIRDWVQAFGDAERQSNGPKIQA